MAAQTVVVDHSLKEVTRVGLAFEGRQGPRQSLGGRLVVGYDDAER